MNLAVLRVEGPDLSLEELKSALSLKCDAQWRKGDTRRNGSVYASSGFSTTVAEAENLRELATRIRSFLERCKEKDVVFSRLNLEGELEIGFSVGDSERFVGSVEFSPSELSLYAECGIKLCITAYPTSDEANAE